MKKSDDLLAFEASLKENPALREKFEAAKQHIFDNHDASSDGEVLIKAAAAVGFSLSLGELERILAERQELDDEELAGVAGGASPGDNFCWIDYYCFTAFWHDDDGVELRPCLADYCCVALYHVEEGRYKSEKSHRYQ